MFCIGDIQDAFNAAFASSSMKKPRPLLIYIHHNNDMLDWFSSKILIEFLDQNYIVWPWDISYPADQQILIKTWQENFPEESRIDFSMDQCPMLIGVIRPFTPTNKYKPEVLLADDVLVRTNEELDLETLIYQLIVFKEEFDRNEQYLSSDFARKIVSCPELIVEISEYLSLNDAVATFSPSVLSLLSSCKINLPVIEPSEEFLQTIIQTKNEDKILSLRFKAGQLKQIMRPALANTYTNVKSLGISELHQPKEIAQIRSYFLNVTCVSLYYDGEIDFHELYKIPNMLPSSVKRLDIYCASIRCSHYHLRHLFVRTDNFNITLESFKLNVKHISGSAVNHCSEAYQKCVLRTIIDFIKIMSNIRLVRIVIKGSIEKLLDKGEWTALINACEQLNEIILRVIKKTLPETQLVQNIQEIKDELHTIRGSIRFDVRVQ